MAYDKNEPPAGEEPAITPDPAEVAAPWPPAWRIFPIVCGGKAPLTENGFYAATDDPARIAAWKEKWPGCNWAVACGASNLTVVDIDGPEGEASWETYCLMHGDPPATREVRTPRGGRHLYFQGEGPTSANLVPKVDLRGVGGYVLLPGSTVNGAVYTVLNEGPIAPLPYKFEGKPRRKAVAVPGVDLDEPGNVSRARDWLAFRVPAVEGEGSDLATYKIAAMLFDFGLTPEAVFDLMRPWADRCTPAFDDDWVWAKINSAQVNRENEIGCLAIPDTVEAFGEMAAALPKGPNLDRADGAGPKDERRFPWREPDEDAALDDLVFWDGDRIWPKVPGGYVGIAYGPSGSYKTVGVLADAMEAVVTKGARVLYLAGEGSFGVKKHHVPALCRRHGINPRDLRGKWRTTRAVNLTDPADVDALISEHGDYRADWVVIDTLATATGGADENAASTAALLTGNGPAGRLKDTFKGLVIFVAHTGKDQAKGVRGSSGYTANVDFVLKFTGDRDTGAVKIFVEKMRDAKDRFSVYRKVIKDDCGVPVAHRATEDEYRALGGFGDARSKELVHDVAEAVRRLEAEGSAHIPTTLLASHLIGPLGKGQDEGEWNALLSAMEQKLQRAILLPKKNEHEKRRPGALYHYVLQDGDHDPVKPYRWKSPEIYDPDGDDD